MKKILCTRTELNVFGKSGELEIFYPERAADEITAHVVLDLAVRELDRLDHLLSAQESGSEVADLNMTAGREYIRVSRETMHLLYLAKKHSLESRTEQAAAFADLKLMPQGKYGYGYDESMAADQFGGYIGGIAMLTGEDDIVSIDEEAIIYSMDQLADIFREYKVADVRVCIGDVEMSAGTYASIYERQYDGTRPYSRYDLISA